MCPRCHQQESPTMNHDHFLTCSASGKQKQRRLQLFTSIFQQLETPSELTTVIVHDLQSFYNSQSTNIHESNHNPYSKTTDIQINKKKTPTNDITNSKIIKSTYNNIGKHKYDTLVHHGRNNSMTTNKKRKNNIHDTIYIYTFV